MSIRFQADNDLKRIIVDATMRHEPRIDFQTAQAARLDGLDDEAVLRQAASQSRILVSHDKRTMPEALASFVASGGTSAGVLVVIPQGAPIREVVETLVLIWADDSVAQPGPLPMVIALHKEVGLAWASFLGKIGQVSMSRIRRGLQSFGLDETLCRLTHKGDASAFNNENYVFAWPGRAARFD